jgi:diaminopimelate decarboxylase
VRLCALTAGKAFLCRAMARWIAEEGLSPDVTTAVRVTPGVDAHAQSAAADVADRQFGFSLSSGGAPAIASGCIRLRLPVPYLVIEPARPRRGAWHRRYNHSMASNYNLVGLPGDRGPGGHSPPPVRRDDPLVRDIGL